MPIIEDIQIWDGNPSPISGSTPFGFYDNDPDFQIDGPKCATYCADQLGYPVVNIELRDLNFYSAFESAITEYGYQINMLNMKDNILGILGAQTGSINYTGKNLTPTLNKLIELSGEYGSEAGSGGYVTWHTGSIQISGSVQRYDLNSLAPGKKIEIKKVFHNSTPAIMRYFDPFIGTGTGTQNFLDAMGFSGMSPGISFLMMPLYDDLLRIQHIEFNDKIRKSGFGFRLINNQLVMFPVPRRPFKLHIEYIIVDERADPLKNASSGSISDSSNAPFQNVVYKLINSVGRRWIYRYSAAQSKETLGQVRAKYNTIPIPNSDTTLNGSELVTEAQTEKEQLIDQLRSDLEELSRKAQLEMNRDQSEFMQDQLTKIPLLIYTG